MEKERLAGSFKAMAERVGTIAVTCADLDSAIVYIREKAGGTILLPSFASSRRLDLAARLRLAGATVAEDDPRRWGPVAAAGVTGVNFALADTGTLVLESTAEAVRLATTLPERHFALLDPGKILPDLRSAAPLLRALQSKPRHFTAFITGPSRTADIERVLTIGVHGPKELHVLLLEGISTDMMEM